jgi:hypothetical protein
VVDWLEPLYDAEQMRATDRWAIEEQGVAGLDLMERAGEALAREADDVAPTGPVVIACGPGNNGGDGFVAARLLRSAGREVRVAVTGDLEKYKGDAKANLDRLPGGAPVPFDRGLLDGAAVVVDALLGTGFSGGSASRSAPRSPTSTRATRPSWRVTSRAGSTRRTAPSRTSRSRRGPRSPSTPRCQGTGSTPARRTRARCASRASGSPTARLSRARSA